MQMPESFLNQYTVIIDEDILQLYAFGQIYSVSAKCLEKLVEEKISGFEIIASKMLKAK